MKKMQHDAGETSPGQSDPNSKESWQWKNGKVFRLSKNDGSLEDPPMETMYVHLIHWKFVMTDVSLKYKDHPSVMTIVKEKIF